MIRYPLVLTAVLAAVPGHAQSVAAPPTLGTPPSLGTPPGPVADPGAAGYARQIVELMLPPERRQEITQGLMQSVMNQMRASVIGRSSDPGLHRIIEDYLAKVPEQLRPVSDRHLPWIMDAMVQAYVHQYSVDELRQISEFGKTSAGAHFLRRSLTILSDPGVTRANQAFFNDAAQAASVGAPQLRTAIVDYLNKHPDVARQVQAQAQAQQQQHLQPQRTKPPH